MRKLLLIAFLSGLTCAAHAQFGNLVGLGVVIGANAIKGRAQSAGAYVTQATYHAQLFPQKRTPAKKLPKEREGGAEVIAIEQLLTSRYEVLQADSTNLVLAIEQEKEFSRLRSNLQAFNPTWSADAYLAEMDFYRQQDIMRKRRLAAIVK